MKAVRYSMITMSLVLCFISVSCRNEDTVSEQFFDEDAVTVRLNLTTRGVETGDSDLLDVFPLILLSGLRPVLCFLRLPPSQG